MPLERRRDPTPDPYEFKTPEARKMYYATEDFLDEAPPTGHLRWQHLYNGWDNAKRRFLEEGDTPEEATSLAWGTIVFGLLERITDIKLAVERGERDGNLLTELNIIQLVNIISDMAAVPGNKNSYQGEFPMFPMNMGLPQSD